MKRHLQCHTVGVQFSGGAVQPLDLLFQTRTEANKRFAPMSVCNFVGI